MNISNDKNTSMCIRMEVRSFVQDQHSDIWKSIKNSIGVEYALTIVLAAASERASGGTSNDVIELINQMLGYRDICDIDLTNYLYNCSNRVVLPSVGNIQLNRVIYDTEKPEDLYVTITHTTTSFFTKSD
ncbi:hypothetical protein [Pseudomonas phage U1B]|nr:hypothetical protein [Pseudomonas phage T2P]QYV99219.1 hypothetical protein [Pseudomonas phage U1B]QYV99675.1 hypothetical protein [Pseudomonas phage U5]